MQIIRSILYLSDINMDYSKTSQIESQLKLIGELACNKNKEHQVSGMLTYRQGRFMQVIEGNELAIESLYQNIKNDPRHKNVRTVLDSRSSNRFYEDCGMSLVLSYSSLQSENFRNYLNDNLNALTWVEESDFNDLNFFINQVLY